MNNKKNDKTVGAYLKSLPTGPLLTKAEEIQLIQNIEVYQKEILGQLVIAKYSRNQLKVYLESLDSSGEEIVNISKKLDEESSKESQTQVATAFKALISELNKSINNYAYVDSECLVQIHRLLDEVSLTGTHIHGVVTEIKKKQTLVSGVESKFKAVHKYFPEMIDLELVRQINDDSNELKARLKAEYMLTDVKVANKMTEWKQVINEYNEVAQNIQSGTFADVRNAYNSISDFEFKASTYKNELITRNLRLVISRAKAHLNKGLDFEDLIQEGNIGLMKAVDKFDSSKKTKVSTYATWWIDQSIKRAISNKGKTVRVPTHIEWMETNLRKTIQKLTNQLGRTPTLKEISVDSGHDIKVLEDLQTRAQHEIGLEEELSSGMSLIDILPSDPMQNPAALVEQKLLREKIREILATLPPRTEKIIRLRFGIGEVPDDEGTTLQSIADQVGITKQGVRVVECSAFKQLRKKARRLVNE